MNGNFENRTVDLTSSNSYSLEAGPPMVTGQYTCIGLWLAYFSFYFSESLDSGQPVLAEGLYKF